MRTDDTVSRFSFRYSQQWRTDPFANVRVPEIDRRLKGAEIVDGRMVIHSLSGHERNHLFGNHGGKAFKDISLISGLDNPADSRGFVIWDYDHDGRQDIALVNANTPLLNLYRNNIGQHQASVGSNAPGFVALRFVGASKTPQPSNFACRDGYGAVVQVETREAILKREHRCGEGYGTQNSATMIVGLGRTNAARSVTVKWPSGARHSIENVQSASLITAYENPKDSPNALGFMVTAYPRVEVHRTSASIATRNVFDLGLSTTEPNDGPRLKLYVTMATWCVACAEHMPDLRHIASLFDKTQIEVFGLPIDENDDPEMLERYMTEMSPPYHQLRALTADQRRKIEDALVDVIPSDALPAAIVTDAAGRILLTVAGTPTVSDLQKALQSISATP